MKTKKIFQKVVVPGSILLLVSIISFGQTVYDQAKMDSGYAPVNGLKMYYEIYGNGEPLVLIHGGVGALEMFGPNISALAKTHKVIAVDLQAHGRTADIDRPLSYELMADDIAAY